jgi:hypothetical protein
MLEKLHDLPEGVEGLTTAAKISGKARAENRS